MHMPFMGRIERTAEQANCLPGLDMQAFSSPAMGYFMIAGLLFRE